MAQRRECSPFTNVGPGFDEFVVGSRLARGFFSMQVLRFSFLHKNQHLQIPVQPG